MKSLFKRLFKTDEPTVAQIDEQLDEIGQRRAEYEARQRQIVDEIAESYGLDTSQLETEHANLGLKLQSLDITAQRLASERQQAAIREIGQEFESRAGYISTATTELQTISPKVEELRAELQRLTAQEQKLRSEINIAKIALSDGLAERAESEGINRADLSAALAAIRTRYPAIDRWVADTHEQALVLRTMLPQEQSS